MSPCSASARSFGETSRDMRVSVPGVCSGCAGELLGGVSWDVPGWCSGEGLRARYEARVHLPGQVGPRRLVRPRPRVAQVELDGVAVEGRPVPGVGVDRFAEDVQGVAVVWLQGGQVALRTALFGRPHP